MNLKVLGLGTALLAGTLGLGCGKHVKPQPTNNQPDIYDSFAETFERKPALPPGCPCTDKRDAFSEKISHEIGVETGSLDSKIDNCLEANEKCLKGARSFSSETRPLAKGLCNATTGACLVNTANDFSGWTHYIDLDLFPHDRDDAKSYECADEDELKKAKAEVDAKYDEVYDKEAKAACRDGDKECRSLIGSFEPDKRPAAKKLCDTFSKECNASIHREIVLPDSVSWNNDPLPPPPKPKTCPLPNPYRADSIASDRQFNQKYWGIQDAASACKVASKEGKKTWAHTVSLELRGAFDAAIVRCFEAARYKK